MRLLDGQALALVHADRVDVGRVLRAARRLGDDFETYHGGDNGVSFNDVLSDIEQFLKLQGSDQETIIMAINRAGSKNKTDAEYCTALNEVMDQSSPRLPPKLDWFWENRIPKLSEVRGKVVLLRRYTDSSPTPRGIDLSVWGSKHDNDTFSVAF